MGDVADMMLDGTLCESCGVYVGNPVGHPRRCDDCGGGVDWLALREAKRAAKAGRLDQFKARVATDPTWQVLSDNHFRKVVDGANRFDYWPSTMKVLWRGKTYHGVEAAHIESFIENRRDR